MLVPISVGLVGLRLFIYGDRAGDRLLRAIGLVVIAMTAVISTFWRAARIESVTNRLAGVTRARDRAERLQESSSLIQIEGTLWTTPQDSLAFRFEISWILRRESAS